MTKIISVRGLKGIRSILDQLNQLLKQDEVRKQLAAIANAKDTQGGNSGGYYDLFGYANIDWKIEMIDTLIARYERNTARVKNKQ